MPNTDVMVFKQHLTWTDHVVRMINCRNLSDAERYSGVDGTWENCVYATQVVLTYTYTSLVSSKQHGVFDKTQGV